jgi:hypothetical protein
MANKKKARKSKSQAKMKDLSPKKRTGAAVKGGRITNIRANASGVPVGGTATSGILQASISTK